MRSSWPRWLAACTACLAVFGCVSCSSVASTSAAPPFKLIWSDDFNGPADGGVNTSEWKFDTGKGIFGTGEIETMTSSKYNAHLDGNGDLDLIVLGHGAAGSASAAWTSARLQSTRLFDAPAGGEMEVTASIKQPDPASADGYWPAFWMLGPGTWPQTGEIDILEDVDGLSKTSGTLHCGNLTQRNANGTFGPCDEKDGLGSGLKPCPGCQQGFNTYSVIVDRRDPGHESIRWFLDGREFYSVSESRVGPSAWNAVVDHGMSIILDVAVGGTFPDGDCDCTSPTAQTSSQGTMVVQYVKVLTN